MIIALWICLALCFAFIGMVNHMLIKVLHHIDYLDNKISTLYEHIQSLTKE